MAVENEETLNKDDILRISGGFATFKNMGKTMETIGTIENLYFVLNGVIIR